MTKWLRVYPMLILLLPMVVAILFCERAGVFYPPEYERYDSLLTYTFVLTSDAKPTTHCDRFEARFSDGKILLYIARDSSVSMPRQGDTLIATTRITRPDSIGRFDYRTYLLRQGIIGTAYVRKYTIHPTPYTLHHTPFQISLYRRLSNAGLSGDELATVGALTLGYKEDLDPELRRHFQASGAAHVLAVSGLHTGIIYLMLTTLLTLGGRWRPLYEDRFGRTAISLIVIAAMWAYAWLTGMTPSVVRAVIMVTFIEIGRIAYRQPVSVNTIAAAAFFILAVRPLDLWSVSFQLSFAATTAIVLFANVFDWSVPAKYGWYSKPINYILGIIIVSLAAQLGTMPITMYTFGQFSTYFLLTNLIVLPLAGLLVPCGLVSIVLGGSMIGVLFSKSTFGLAWLMNHYVAFIESLPYSTIPANVNGPMVAIFYFALLLLYLSLAPLVDGSKKGQSCGI